MSLGPVAKLRAVVVAAQGWSATAYPVEVLASHEDADEDATLTIGDLRALLAHIDQLERRATALETPSDHERLQFIRQAAIAFAAAYEQQSHDGEQLSGFAVTTAIAVVRAIELWAELQRRDV